MLNRCYAIHMLSNKVIELAESARYDVCLASCSSGATGKRGRIRKPDNPLQEWIYPASVPGQGQVPILKILQSNSCRNNCSYCQFASSNDGVKRVSLSPDELASSFMALVQDRLVEGIFLSSGVCSTPSRAMENMVKTAAIIRRKYRFGGYIHLKIIPGCAEHLVDAAASLADRLSINIEAPTEHHLRSIAPDKNIRRDILPAAGRIAELLKKKRNGNAGRTIRTSSQTTQYVVGAAGEKDIEIMSSVDLLYRDYFMFRAYFSAYQQRYNPAAAETGNNPEEAFGGSPLLREHRLYQCDFLMRAYGFRFPDLVFDSMGNIPLETDPKTAWAVLNPQLYPVEVNKADFSTLLRVPGIGPVAAERIIRMRQAGAIKDIETLKSSGAWTGRAAGWIELDGRAPMLTGKDCRFNPAQRWLFEELAPDGWQTAASVNTSDEEKSTGKSDRDRGRCRDGKEKNQNGPYPGQKGKWVNYQFKRSDKKIMCR